MSHRERRVFKFVCRPASETEVRKALDAVASSLGEGDDALRVASFMRGSAVYLLFDGSGDPFERLRGDAKGKKLVVALSEHASFDPDDVVDEELGRIPPRDTEPVDEVPRASAAALVPVLDGAEEHLRAALLAVPPEALRAARVADVFLGSGELVLVAADADAASLADALTLDDARPLTDALETFTAHEPFAPGRYVLRPVSEAGELVRAERPGGRVGFTTDGG